MSWRPGPKWTRRPHVLAWEQPHDQMTRPMDEAKAIQFEGEVKDNQYKGEVKDNQY